KCAHHITKSTHRNDMYMSHFRSLIIGDTSPAEFTPVVDLIRRRMDASSLRWEPDFNAFRKATASGWWPEMIVILQAWADQYPAWEVEALISLCPLARIMCCFGPWCDSDGRSRSIWPLGVRVPAAAFASRFEHELALLSGGRDAGPSLPLTASRTEIFEFDFADSKARQTSAAAEASVVSPDRRFGEMVVSALRKSGLSAGQWHDAGAAATVIFDADPWNEERGKALAAIRAAQPQSQLVACVGFSRPHLETELHDAGADAVWFKLSPLTDLMERLDELRPLAASP